MYSAGGRATLAVVDPGLVAMVVHAEICGLTWKALFLLHCTFLLWENFPRHTRLCAASQGVLRDWQK